MALINIDNVGQVGIVKEKSSWNLPPNVWSDGNNIKTEEGSIKKCPGYSEVMATCPIAPFFITQITLGDPEFWVVGGLTAIYAYDNTGSSTTLNGDINSSVTTITVTSTTGFESVGTITIGEENITYTGKTTHTLTGCTRGTSSTTAASHIDNKKVINYTKVRVNLSTVTPTTTKIDTRGRGRQGNLLISSNAVGDNWRFGTLRLDVKPDGGR